MRQRSAAVARFHRPGRITRLLPYLVIAEIAPEPLRIRHRLVGTRVVEANGSDYTNRYLDECDFLVEPLLVECYRRLEEKFDKQRDKLNRIEGLIEGLMEAIR
jgi:hypothetical protein